MNDDAVREVARAAGIAVEWTDAAGAPRQVAPDVLRSILQALGLPCGNAVDLAASRDRLIVNSHRYRLPRLITAEAGKPVMLPEHIRGPARLVLDDGSRIDVALEPRQNGCVLGPIAHPGYHELQLDRQLVKLAVAPQSAFSIEDAAGERVWGLAAQLYGLRRPGDAGIGDTEALSELIHGAACHGADAIALSPTHALFSADPHHYSPYSPSSRLFFNPLLADPAAACGSELVKAASRGPEIPADLPPQGPKPIKAAPSGELIDWPAAAARKHAMLRRIFEACWSRWQDGLDETRSADFAKFRQAGGKLLEQHATFEALHAAMLQTDPARWNWRSWPAEWRDPTSPAVAQFADAHKGEINFHLFLQWIADRGLAAAQSMARGAGMRIGLISDLAVGTHSGGSHAWSRPDDLLVGLSVGAPPDLFNAAGQNWGVTAFSPQALAGSSFEPFVATLRAVMRHAGGVRIDHAMGLTRLWVIPEGARPVEGAYLAYPVDDLIRLLKLESVRHRALVIGEDLGTVPAGFRERLDAAGMAGMRVLWFEREAEKFLAPEMWSSRAVAMTTTHDLPTVAGWWCGRDIATRERLGLVSRAVAQAERRSREGDRERLWGAFRVAGVSSRSDRADGAGRHGNDRMPGADEPASVIDAGVKFIAATPSAVALLPLEDALGLEDQPNFPGTVEEYPNWRRRYPTDAAAIFDLPEVISRAQSLNRRITMPLATLRLQFHKGFTFADAARLVPYFDALNVSHLYTSPILTARAGSAHGYDVVDPTTVNEELGGEPGYRELVAALRRAGMGIVVDIVPNHMAVGGNDNEWWLDVLQHGGASRYADFFDIDWEPEDAALQGKVLVPVLGRPYGEVMRNAEITLAFNCDRERYEAGYFHHVFPITPADGGHIERMGLRAFDARTPAGRRRLHGLLERQNFRLAWWRSANDAINWRRFFDINELAALRVEGDRVFEATHATLLRLFADGLIDGMRIDHVDGLADPGGYCRKLRSRLDALSKQRPPGSPLGHPYLVVEKILGRDETLPGDWGADGTTGYDFMDQVSRLLHDPAGAEPLGRLWTALSGRPAAFEVEEERSRREILDRSFSAQLGAAVAALHRLAVADLATRDIAAPAIRRALVEILAHLRVYRTYTNVERQSDADRRHLAHAVAGAKSTCFAADRYIVDRVAEWVGGEGAENAPGALRASAIRKFQQLSAPLAAKAVEDTAFYRHGLLLSRLDVGFDPWRFAEDVTEFHHACRMRAECFPHAILATASHDHKRGEDIRARLAVLSEFSADWSRTLEGWIEWASAFSEVVDGVVAPSRGDTAILFQTIVGAWPPDLSPSDRNGCNTLAERLAAWQQKALREAKLMTDWSAPNERYEAAARHYLMGLFDSERLAEIAAFAHRIAPAGAANGLAQTLLKLTAPGVPDIYQGTEFWDLSLVDPDNRRPVDFEARIAAIRADRPAAALAPSWRDGRVKQALIRAILGVRRKQRKLFESGEYVPLACEGPAADHVLAFARRRGRGVALTVVSRLVGRLIAPDDGIAVPRSAWADTRLVLPCKLRNAREILTGAEQELDAASVAVSQVLGRLPVALLIASEALD